MREIKFKAWDTKNKVWLESLPPDDSDLMPNPQFPLRTFDGRIEYVQFTGLRDKNGKEIYEGDILDSGNSAMTRCKGTVSYVAPAFGILWDFAPLSLYPFPDSTRLEVIGSIHENPGLLK